MIRNYIFECQNGDRYAIPVEIIARNRAEEYAGLFGGDIEKSLKEDTIPLFEEDTWNIEDWARNNMNWSDVEKYAIKLPNLIKPDPQADWVNPADTEYTDDILVGE